MNIVMTAFGKRGYFFAAYNLAFSIKHFDPDCKILLIHDSGLKDIPTDVFDKFHEIDEATISPQGSTDAGHVKLCTYKIATKYFSKYLFLDVDAIALKSLQPWYDSIEKDFATDVRGKGGIKDVINYSVWAENKDIWSEFDLGKKPYYAIQSSWHFAKKTKENGAMFRDALKLNRTTFVDRKMLTIRWGKNLPDELVLGGAIARRDYDPSIDFTPIFFGDKYAPLSDVKDHYILSLFGNGKGKTITKRDYMEFYDRHARKLFKEKGLNHHYKVNFIMRDKYIN